MYKLTSGNFSITLCVILYVSKNIAPKIDPSIRWKKIPKFTCTLD
jgi:hypothetical protein